MRPQESVSPSVTQPPPADFYQCLLPLANIPLIEYTLEFLSLAGVEDVFIFASSHADKIEEYIRNSKWNKASSPFKKCKIVMSTTSMSVGDAMRELDGKGLITTDFLLVNGDFVSNLPLEDVLKVHRERRTKSKDAIMTMILREAGADHRSKARGEAGVFVIAEANKQCVHYEEMRGSNGHAVLLPVELMKQHPTLRVRSDLIDCQVDICSPDVPALFTENFDYQHMRRDFLHGILMDFELYGKTVHTHIISEGYAARVRSLQTYDAVSKDVIERWAYPFVPDNNLAVDQNYTHERFNIYKEQGITLARGCVVGRNTVLGRDACIGENSHVSNSVIGSGVKIGKGVILNRAYIWDNVVIGDGCRIQNSIIANGAVLGSDCSLEGTIISFGVKVANGSELPARTRISGFRQRKLRDDDDDDDEPVTGSEYEDSDSESEDEQQAAAQDGLGKSSSYVTKPFELTRRSLRHPPPKSFVLLHLNSSRRF